MSRAPIPQIAEPSPTEPRHSLWQAVARSVRDNVIAEFAVQAIRLGGFVVLARALSPDNFGVFRVLLVVGVFAALSNDAGVPDALIQRKEITQAHEATAWWLCMLTALCATLILYAAAPLIAKAMNMPRLSEDARLLCLPILLDATAAIPSARLRRALNFSALAAADVLAEVAFITVALLVLWRGMPVWSLPGGLAARFTVHAITIWVADPHLPHGRPTRQAARDFARFSISAWGSRIVYVLSSNADYLLVGRLLGSSALGFYSMAWDLLRFVPDRLHRVAGRVTFPAFCKLQDDPAALSRAYLDFFDYMARVVLPIVACAVIAAPEILGTIYGPQWLPSALPMRLLAPGLALAGLRLGIGSVYYSKNRPALDIYLHGVRLILLVITVLGLARWGLFGISLGMSVVESLVSLGGQALACALIGLTLRDLARSGIPALRLAALCALACVVGKAAAVVAGAGSATILIAAAAPPALVYLWLERANAMDLIGKAFVPSTGPRAKESHAQA
ncbi:MAG: lipopolysaccharide biosynthesis protein [Candidatus Binataceae bacterium]